jgi:drug/metabolite transporter (DMT)-like permease
MFRNPLASHRRAALLLAFCALCWSIAGVVTRHLERADSFEVTFWRSLFCAITVLSILAWQRRGHALAPLLEMGWPGLFSGAMWAVMFTCFMLALTRTSVANTLLVMSVSPLLAALLGRLVLGTRVSAPTWLAIAMAGAGIGWMVHDGVSADGLAGMTIALAVPVASAINIVVLKRVHADVDLAPAVLVGALLSCLATVALAWPFEASLRDLALLALLGAIQLAVPCFLMIRAVRHLAPHEVALIALLEVVLGPIWAWLGAGEAMPMATLQGGLIVLAALIGDTVLNRRAPPIAATAAGPAGLH